MQSLEKRIASFKNWPHSQYSATPIDFAKAGFFFSTRGKDSHDNVCCYMCGKNLDTWAPSDSPWKEHCAHSPSCPLVTLYEMESRKKTFGKWWPHKYNYTATPQALAEAGFFYHCSQVGDDCVVCFQCGVALDGWEVGDEPLVEHKKRNAECPYLLRGEGGNGAYLAMFSSEIEKESEKLVEKKNRKKSEKIEKSEKSEKVVERKTEKKSGRKVEKKSEKKAEKKGKEIKQTEEEIKEIEIIKEEEIIKEKEQIKENSIDEIKIKTVRDYLESEISLFLSQLESKWNSKIHQLSNESLIK